MYARKTPLRSFTVVILGILTLTACASGHQPQPELTGITPEQISLLMWI